MTLAYTFITLATLSVCAMAWAVIRHIDRSIREEAAEAERRYLRGEVE